MTDAYRTDPDGATHCDVVSETTFCRDCRHCQDWGEDGGGRVSLRHRPTLWKCASPTLPIDHMTGEAKAVFCSVRRSGLADIPKGGACPDYEAKPKPEPKASRWRSYGAWAFLFAVLLFGTVGVISFVAWAIS